MTAQGYYPSSSANQPSSSGLLALQGCVSSLNASLSTLGNSLATLDTGITDFPRMQKLLTVNRHFELITESEVKDAQKDLADEVTPQIVELLKRAETSLAKLERKHAALKSKVTPLASIGLTTKADLQAVRLSQKPTRPKVVGAAAAGEDKAVRENWKLVRGRKERLGYTAERLGLEIEQKERQLRMSLSRASMA